MNDELQEKEDLIQKLYAALGQKDLEIKTLNRRVGTKDEQLMQVTKNCELLTSSLMERDNKRDRSQQAIKDTLKNLEQKLNTFTEQSQHN